MLYTTPATTSQRSGSRTAPHDVNRAHSGSPSTIHASWKWSVIDTWEDMDGPEASMMLEHLADWK